MADREEIALTLLSGLAANPYRIKDKPEVLVRDAFLLAKLFEKGPELLAEYEASQLPKPQFDEKPEDAVKTL